MNVFTRNEMFNHNANFNQRNNVVSELINNQSFRGVFRTNEPMSRHTTWRVGGVADQYFEPADRDDLCVFLQRFPLELPLLWVGLGSNLLVRDGGFRGAVIVLGKDLGDIEISDTGIARVGAGVSCARFARHSARQSFSGAEFMAGIPGTIGGALAMNAGAHGTSTWDIVREVETVNRSGNIRTRLPAEFEIGYRSVSTPGEEWFIEAGLQLQPDPDQSALQRIDEMLKHRSATQPVGQPNSGSVFRNPDNNFAARLIEKSGLKGFRVGGAIVSDKHANFIINTGVATAADIEKLILHIQETVYSQHQVKLEPEVRIVGEPS